MLWSLDDASSILFDTIPLADYFLPSLDDVCLVSGLNEPAPLVVWLHRQGARTVV